MSSPHDGHYEIVHGRSSAGMSGLGTSLGLLTAPPT